MTIEDRFGSTQSGFGQSQSGQSQSGTPAGTARSAEYDDNLTVQDTTHGAEPRAQSLAPGATALAGTTGLGDRGRALGDNRDGLGRDRTDAVTADESGTLISADKVVGTAVYDAAGERLGTIDSIMLNKRSGKVAYAVMSFGGFLGIGERYHPLPWDVLTYDQAKGGYNVQHSADDLRKAPNYSRDEVDTFNSGSTASDDVDTYYGVPVGREAFAGAPTDTSRGERIGGPSETAGVERTFGASATGIEAADAIGSTTGAGSTGMGSTAMGANRNF